MEKNDLSFAKGTIKTQSPDGDLWKIKKPGNPHPVDQEKSAPSRVFIPRQIKILVAEDNPVNQKVVGMILKRYGFSATIADNGSQLIQRLKQATYDLILMDIQMPGMDGIQATKIIRDSESEIRCKPIPIIAMTAHATHEDELRCLDAGMDGFLAKPVTGKELLSMIRKVLENNKSSNGLNRPSA